MTAVVLAMLAVGFTTRDYCLFAQGFVARIERKRNPG
jgi:hypothetical protein